MHYVKGNPKDGNPKAELTPKFGWLGAKVRSAELGQGMGIGPLPRQGSAGSTAICQREVDLMPDRLVALITFMVLIVIPAGITLSKRQWWSFLLDSFSRA